MAEDGQRIRICPQCGSDDVEADFTEAAMARAGGSNKWHCNHCDYIGMVFPEVPLSEVPDDPIPVEDLPEREQVDLSYGKGMRGAWKITGPIGMILSIGGLALALQASQIQMAVVFAFLSVFSTILTAYAYRIIAPAE